MATETVLDYLGHPCQIAEAFDRFEESVENARKLEPRALVRQIGIQLNALNDRNEHSSNALRLARDSLNNSDDAEKVQSLLALAVPFDVESCIRLQSLAGLVLVALEHGNLLEARHG